IKIPTPELYQPGTVLDNISNKVPQLNNNQKAIALGVILSNQIFIENKISNVPLNFDSSYIQRIAEELEAKTGLKTVVGDHANSAGVGEVWIGAGKNYRDLISVRIKTGISGAIILNQKLFTGRLGTAGKLGLITLNPEGHSCNSGNKGSFEQHCSEIAIKRHTGKTFAEWGALAEQNDATAIKFWQDYGALLGAALTTLIYIFNPEVVIIGGDVCASAKFFLPVAQKEEFRSG
ncbi:UNVERIFIED_CONTAM: glucokinase, partial [Euhalothece sp. KZN 001]